MKFDNKNFCPYIIDKSTPLKKFLYCTKIKGLCKMVTYFPNGQMEAKRNVKKSGCPYGCVIQDIGKKNQVTQESNVLDDISMKEKKVDIEPKQENEPVKKKTTKKSGTKKTNTKKRNTTKKGKKKDS